MEKFLSTYGYPASALDTVEKLNGMKELVHEFCTAFGVKITHNKATEEGFKRRGVDVVDNNGFPLGQLQISSNGAGDKLYIYECEGIIRKQKSSANSGQSARDSTKISGLIKSLKTHAEYPMAEGCYKQFKTVINFGFGQMDRVRVSSSINVDKDKFMAIAHEILGIEYEGYYVDRDWIRSVVNNFKKEESKKNEGKKLLERFAKGMTVIRLPHNHYRGGSQESFYLIGKATYDTANDKVATIGDFIRYDSISDTPYAGLAVMCKTYMSKTPHGCSSGNDFGIDRGDAYIADLDITNCYAGNTHMILIPDHAE